jgi:hypothetical protein
LFTGEVFVCRKLDYLYLGKLLKHYRTVFYAVVSVSFYVVYDVFSMLPFLVAVIYGASYMTVFALHLAKFWR